MNEHETRAGLAVTPGYEYARRVGDQLFVAGQVPHDSEGQIVGINDSCSQAAQCLHNLNTLLSVHGFCANDIQRIVVYVVGEPEQLARAWSGVDKWFAGRVPPATLLGMASLGHSGQLVEVDATVVKDPALANGGDA
jgi:enamine deaminase RidA (YjgF/YER057c/UK114 family)